MATNIQNSLLGSSLGLYQDPRQMEREIEHMKQQEMAMRQMRAMQNAFAPNPVQPSQAVPQPDPGTNPVLLLTGEDE